MNTKHVCQSCGMPIESVKFMGTEHDGSPNADYCIYCYINGEFYHPSLTLEEMKGEVRLKMKKLNMAPDEIEKAVDNLSQLKRWRSPALQM